MKINPNNGISSHQILVRSRASTKEKKMLKECGKQYSIKKGMCDN